MGLNEPLLVQYATYMGDLLRGDLGVSLINGQPITEILSNSIGYTLKLAALAALLSIGLAIPLGVLAAWKRNSLFDQGTMLIAVIGMGIPNFFLAVLLIQLFTVRLRLVAGGRIRNAEAHHHAGHRARPPKRWRSICGSFARRCWKSWAATTSGRSRPRALTNTRILWVHVLRNALPPVIALAGIMMRTLLGYTLIVETIFRWPGLGYQLVNAVLKRDYTVAQTLAILLTAAVILFNTMADLLQQWADPRTRRKVSS